MLTSGAAGIRSKIAYYLVRTARIAWRPIGSWRLLLSAVGPLCCSALVRKDTAYTGLLMTGRTARQAEVAISLLTRL